MNDKLQIIYTVIEKLSRRSLLNWIPDPVFLKIVFRGKMGKRLNLSNPRTFNEKLQWLKLYDRNKKYPMMVDKYLVKRYVADKLGEQYIIPTLGVWESFDQIDFNLLPNRFVLKCTHDSGGLVICKDKSSFDVASARKVIEKSLKRNYYSLWREWPYKMVKPRIIAEKYMTDGKSDLKDYKLFCFNGKVKFFKIDFDRFTHHRANYYDLYGKILPFGEADYPPNPEKHLDIPDQLPEMIVCAEKLAENIPFVRVDFYDVNGQVYFGEITFYPASGLGKLDPIEWDNNIGSLIQLPEKTTAKRFNFGLSFDN